MRGELHARRSAHEADERTLETADSRVAALVEHSRGLEADARRLTAELAAAAEAEKPLVGEVDAAQHAEQVARAALDQSVARRVDATAVHTAGSARVEALTMALHAARARAGADRLAEFDGALGPLLDLVQVDDGWEAAVEAALGEALAAVVVTDAAAARRALHQLDPEDVSGGVLPVPAAVPSATPPTAGHAVRDHVRPRPGLVAPGSIACWTRSSTPPWSWTATGPRPSTCRSPIPPRSW